MGRAKKSAAADNGDGEAAPLRNSVSGSELRAYIERIEYVNEQQKELSVDRSEIYKGLKLAGYARDEVREIVNRRKMTRDQRQVRAATLDMYLTALGDFADTPLGQAGAVRMREGDSA